MYAASGLGTAKGPRKRNQNSMLLKIEEMIDVFKLMNDLDGSKDIETLTTFIVNDVIAFASELPDVLAMANMFSICSQQTYQCNGCHTAPGTPNKSFSQ